MEDRKGVSLDERGGREQLEGVERGKCNQDILCGKKNKPNINEMKKKRTLRKI